VGDVRPVAQKDRPRERALAVLCGAERGTFADSLLEAARREFEGRDSAFILELVYGVLRHRSLLDWTLDRFSANPLGTTDIETRNILRLGAYQLLFLDRVPASAAVNTSTELSKEYGRKSGYVNGLLRSLERSRNALPPPAFDDPVRQLSVRYSHPEWLVRRWVARFGRERTGKLLTACNRPAPLIIRTNILRATRDELKQALVAEGADARETLYSPAGLELLSSPGLNNLAAFLEGRFLVQDEAAQLVGMMVAPAQGDTVLDACAAPGGKATHLAELMGNRGSVVALDSDAGRLNRVAENSARLGTTIVRPVVGDAAKYREALFDKVLVDAPCSGLGVLRRHPDGRWTKGEKIVAERRTVQRNILKNCATLLKPGGALVYATCTTEPEENEDLINAFIASGRGEFRIDDPRQYLPPQAHPLVGPDGFFRTFPDEPSLDGFFGARLVRNT
jgi:16S rRNA (cytosine967-C5)-methyltransferase